MIKGFRDFILRGNVIDLAVAVVIGAAFGALVSSVVKNFITPMIAMAGGVADFSTMRTGPILWGVILNDALTFLITAAVVYRMQKLVEMSGIDGLTGLPNRTWLLHRFPGLLDAARADGVSLCLALIDLDGFKRINDEIGHHAGDRALLHVVGLLQDAPEDGEWLIRLGGEEFVMILRKPLGTSWERLDGLRRALLARRFVPEQGADPLLVTFSAGLACYPHDAEDLSNLLRRADLRLNAAKRNGRNRILARDA